MGSVYSHRVMGQANPVVGLMSIGSEDSKGTEVTKESFRLLQKSGLNFRGNVEGHDLFRGETDVVVCDGFVGNIVLKTAESVAHAIGSWLKAALMKNMLNKMAALVLQKDLRAMKSRMDPEMYGGAPLLGVNGTCIITHGSSSRRAIYHAIRVSIDAVNNQVNHHIVEEISKRGKP
jgi:glycerol-3-phosphate acyltransferase PlsX